MSYREAQERIPSQIEKIVNLLKEAGEEGVTNVALSAISFKYDARLSELRSRGYEIETTHEAKSVYKYVLKKIPADEKFLVNATDEIIMIVEADFNGSITTNELIDLLDQKHFHITRKSGWYKQKRFLH
jgi:hypothetical protein